MTFKLMILTKFRKKTGSIKIKCVFSTGDVTIFGIKITFTATLYFWSRQRNHCSAHWQKWPIELHMLRTKWIYAPISSALHIAQRSIGKKAHTHTLLYKKYTFIDKNTLNARLCALFYLLQTPVIFWSE